MFINADTTFSSNPHINYNLTSTCWLP